MIYDFMLEICDILNISVPKISFDTSNFTSDTMQAQMDSFGETIYLKSNKLNVDLCFFISHELRHLWQMTYDYELYLSDYKPREQCSSLEEYNLQIAEIDANAFAGLVMIEFFHLKPLFNGLPDNVKEIIYKKMEELEATEFN